MNLRIVTPRSKSASPQSRYLDDLSLMRRVSDRDEKAMNQIYTLYAGPLSGFVKRCLVLDSDADDIVHETMMEIWRRPERYEGRSSLKSWIFSIARYKSFDRNRRGSRVVLTDDIDEKRVCDAALPSDALEISQDTAKVRAAMETLSDTHRRVLHLSFFEDMSYKEIAEIERCPVGTVKTRVLHGKKNLMHILKNMND